MSLQTFITQYYNETEPNPLADHERCWQWRVALWLERSKSYSETIYLNGIRSLERGVGNGSAGLDWLCALADQHQVNITGIVEPIKSQFKGLNKYQLKAWYRRHGFVMLEHDHMVRYCINTGDNKACRSTAVSAQ